MDRRDRNSFFRRDNFQPGRWFGIVAGDKLPDRGELSRGQLVFLFHRIWLELLRGHVSSASASYAALARYALPTPNQRLAEERLARTSGDVLCMGLIFSFEISPPSPGANWGHVTAANNQLVLACVEIRFD